MTLEGPGYTGRFQAVLRDFEEWRVSHAAFAGAAGILVAASAVRARAEIATHVAERGLDGVRLTLVIPEQQPLELFGAVASQTVRELLDERGIELHASRYPTRARRTGCLRRG